MDLPIEKSILINSPPQKVWEHLTKPEPMLRWMGGPELQIEVLTDWVVGKPIIIKGFHHAKFENKGLVLQFEPFKIIQYSHLNSISKLPGILENYSIFTFKLSEQSGQTFLELRIENFPTETIYKHLEFYWRITLDIIKNSVENP